MGLYDRHYVRDQPQRGGLGAGGRAVLSMVSVNTWIILICIVTFALDQYVLPEREVLTDVFEPPALAEVDRSKLSMAPVYDYIQVHEKLPGGKEIARPALCRAVTERSTGRHVGWAEVMRMHYLESYLHFSTRLAFFWPHMEWWRFIGFQFLHANGTHLLFNMLGLFFFGPLVEQFLGSKRYLAFYLLCGICGAIMYLFLNLSGYVVTMLSEQPVKIPGLLFDNPSTPLVGASAGIFGVLMAGAYIAPSAVVYFFFVLPMRMRTMAYAFVALAFVSLITGGHNAGGEAGHLGGAIAGYYFVRRPYHLHGFFDLLGRADPTSHHYRRSTSRQVGSKTSGRSAEIDRILQKISSEGIHSLTDSEKRTLHEASRRGA